MILSANDDFPACGGTPALRSGVQPDPAVRQLIEALGQLCDKLDPWELDELERFAMANLNPRQ